MKPPYLGELRLDPNLNVPGTSPAISLRLSLDDVESEADVLGWAEGLCRSIVVWRRRVEDFAIQKLLPLKNEAWLKESEAPITPEDFRARMKLVDVSIYAEGAFVFLHEDGDLFAGHCIQVSGSLLEGPTHADIPG